MASISNFNKIAFKPNKNECLHQIFDNYAYRPSTFVTVLIFSKNDSSLQFQNFICNFIHDLPIPVTIYSDDIIFESTNDQKVHEYLIASYNPENLFNQLNKVAQMDNFNRQAQFLFITNDFNTSKKFADTVSKMLLTNVLVIAVKEIKIFRIAPKFCDKNGFILMENLCTKKLRKFELNFEKCIFQIFSSPMKTYVEDQIMENRSNGLAIDLFRLINDHTDLKFKFLTPDSIHLTNLLQGDDIAELKSDKICVENLGYIYLSNDKVDVFQSYDFSTYLFQDAIVWVVPKARKIKHSKFFWIVFDFYVWMVILFVLVFVSMMIASLGKLGFGNRRRSFTVTIFHLISLNIGKIR